MEILHRYTRAVIYKAEVKTKKGLVVKAAKEGADLRGADLGGADLEGADLEGADLRGADLRGADLRGADLGGADLEGADLEGADLRGAYLRGADLEGAYLRGAKNLNLIKINPPLAILKNQKNKLIAYKYLNPNMESPYQGFEYKVGKTYQVKTKDCNKNEFEPCGSGLNLATLDWCLKDCNFNLSNVFIEVEFDPKDIIAIPYLTDGKFRVSKMKILRKISKEELEKYIKKMTLTNAH